MSLFTFTNSPATSNRDAVRVLVNDTTETGHALSDATIAWLLSSHSSLWFAAAAAAELIAGQFSADVTEKQVGDLRLKKGGAGSDPATQYRMLAKHLRTRGALLGAKGPFSGGISQTENTNALSDSDYERPRFAVGMFDNPPNLATSTSTAADTLVF